MRGVNLGAWLVLEKWITPSLFAGTDAKDEYTFMQTPGAKEKLERHRQSFITEADFKWLREHSINAVRIPVGYWILEDDAPFVSGIEYLDWAVLMAERYDLKVLIDLHGAPGSQNGQDHSGRIGPRGWFHDADCRERTIIALERLAARYEASGAVWGVELLNEPRPTLLNWRLRRFYQAAYRRICRIARPGTHIVFHDAFRPRMMSGAISGSGTYPVAMDVHWYQFAQHFQKWRRPEAYFRTVMRRPRLLACLQKRQPVIVGEWSLVLTDTIMRELSSEEKETALRRNGELQLEAYASGAGWFYWTYKTERRDVWNFRALIEDGRLKLR